MKLYSGIIQIFFIFVAQFCKSHFPVKLLMANVDE